ncbi:unnamed protein product [Rotaria sp. Silwood1]|nr:unnamed protein product [Rotaria sp. Silwood1]CAF5132284.1 unnamed protein product [Rotaria sp. Silwood1]
MLIGSDSPIFGDEQQPAVSLRLREMNKPINALTDINCWLNDLIYDEPELAMCPNDDIVTLYDLINLCDTDCDDNLHTLPVATLCYKMSYNIVLNSDFQTRLKESGTICTLFIHYLDMLDAEKFSEYMMAELLIDDNSSELNWICDEITILSSEFSQDTLSFKNEKKQTSDDIDQKLKAIVLLLYQTTRNCTNHS